MHVRGITRTRIVGDIGPIPTFLTLQNVNLSSSLPDNLLHASPQLPPLPPRASSLTIIPHYQTPPHTPPPLQRAPDTRTRTILLPASHRAPRRSLPIHQRQIHNPMRNVRAIPPSPAPCTRGPPPLHTRVIARPAPHLAPHAHQQHKVPMSTLSTDEDRSADDAPDRPCGALEEAGARRHAEGHGDCRRVDQVRRRPGGGGEAVDAELKIERRGQRGTEGAGHGGRGKHMRST